MQKQRRKTRGTTFWKNLFSSAAEIQKEQISTEIARIELLSRDLCRALEPIVERIERHKTINPQSKFFGCVQVLRALDTRKQRLQLYQQVDRKSQIFDIQDILEAPLLVQTSPKPELTEGHYGIAPANLESFVELFVEALEAESQQLPMQ